MTNEVPPITVKVEWDAEAKVWCTAYCDVPGFNLEADTIEELRNKVLEAIEDLTGRQIPFELSE